MTTTLDTDVVVIGSGAGGATTAAVLAEAGRRVLVLEEGPWVEADSVEPFSLDEFVAKYRHHGLSAMLGTPPIAYAEGRCVGGSTEINSGLWHRLPDRLAREWADAYAIDDFGPGALDGYAARVEAWQSVSRLPGEAPESSAVLERGARALGWRSVEFPRVFAFDDQGRGTKQTMTRTLIPRARAGGAEILAECRVERLERVGPRVSALRATRRRPDGTREPLRIRAGHVFVCGGAIQTPALLQRSGIRRNIGTGLRVHPTVKVTASFEHPLDHDGVPMHRITEFSPHLTIGGSASRRGHIAMSIAHAGIDPDEVIGEWRNLSVYYAAIRSTASGRVLAVPGLRTPLVAYRLTSGDMSRLARGLVHLGEVLLAAGARALYPSVHGAPVVTGVDGLGAWWDALDRAHASLMTIHLTSSVRMGEDRAVTGADSYGAVWDTDNLRVNDAALLPDAPGVNPQASIMSIALRNAEHFLATT